MRKIIVSFIVLATFVAVPLRAEINMAASLEWLCVDADVVVKGTVISVKEIKSDKGISAIIRMVKTSVYKGQTPDTFEIHTDYYSPNWITKAFKGKSILAFLKYNPDQEKIFHPLKIGNSQHWSLIELGEKAKGYAGNFKVLKTEKEIIEYIIPVIKETDGKRGKMYLLDIPYETEAFGDLYSGSSCFLYVPDFMFPKAKKGFFE
jgi:hypothetical protein